MPIIVKNLFLTLALNVFLGVVAYGAIFGPNGHWVAATILGAMFILSLVFSIVAIFIIITED